MTEATWTITYENDVGPNDEGFWEWWNVTDGRRSFKCDSEDDANFLLASMIPAGGLAEEARRMDWLESMANKPGGLLLHDGSERGRVGLGLRPGRLSRTLREAIDAAMASSTHQGKETP